MTAEVVVMNKTAVALAADSAVTITAKIFNSAEKLYMLVPGKPVALMVYNHSEFMQLPWETIVKEYRIHNNGNSFSKLADYSNDFFSFLKDSNNNLYSDEQYEVTFKLIIHFYFEEIARKIIFDINERIERKAKKISHKEIKQVISEWINKYYEQWDSEENQFNDKTSKGIIKSFSKKYDSDLDQIINNIFGEAELSNNDKEKLKKFSYSLFYKNRLTDFYSGIVIAGFGEDELYPTCEEYLVENYFFNNIKMRKKGEAKVCAKDIGWVISFAQKDVVKNFMNGIHPDLEELLCEKLNILFSDNNLAELKNSIKGLKKERKEKILSALTKLKNEKIDPINSEIQEKFKKEHTDSILKTVAVLPKDELAKMAESLVNITSFMRRVSMEIETVGGPIDVAVISKKDGFIWIKRKHYFEKEYNIHFGI
jgi:hypothetical protein